MAWANDFQRATVLLFIIALPPLLLFPDVALRVMYSGKFVGAAAFVALFIATEVFTLLSGTYQALIIAGDRMLFHVIQNLTAQALLIGVAAFAIPRLGLAGAGVAALTAPLFLYATTLLFLRRRYDIHVSGEARLMALVTAGIVVIGGSIGSGYPGLSAGLLVMKAAACGLIWLGAYLIIPAPDRSRLRDGGARLKREVFLRTARLMGTA
jgi:O-antigen/teichoic acid export membrane protein